ncbi:unnamed protein product [Lathyrus oleraceus]
MMTTVIPKTCLKEIQQMQRAFIWGDSHDKHHMHTIRWSVIVLPKYQGGLEIRKLEFMNQACIAKLGWQLKNGKQTLWCDVIRSKYITNRQQNDRLHEKTIGTSLWKQLVLVWPQMESLTFWEMRNNKEIRFWEDAWIEPGMKLISKLQNQNLKVDSQATVDTMVTQNGDWNWNILSALIDNVTLEKIKVIPPHTLNSREADMRIWSGTANGEFTIASMHQFLAPPGSSRAFNNRIVWKSIRQLQVPERIRCFIWKLFHNGLTTNKYLGHLQLRSANYDVCRSQEETSLHALRDCVIAKQVWSKSLLAILINMNFFKLISRFGFKTIFRMFTILDIGSGARFVLMCAILPQNQFGHA